MNKYLIARIAKRYIAAFQDPKYNPYDYDNYLLGLKNAGFNAEYDSFAQRHPEIVGDSGIMAENPITMKAIETEIDLKSLGDFILAYGLYRSQGAYSAMDVDYKWDIKPLQRLLQLCKL